jgi:hypothetical protein
VSPEAQDTLAALQRMEPKELKGGLAYRRLEVKVLKE